MEQEVNMPTNQTEAIIELVRENERLKIEIERKDREIESLLVLLASQVEKSK